MRKNLRNKAALKPSAAAALADGSAPDESI
jgi:hypothetical protein